MKISPWSPYLLSKAFFRESQDLYAVLYSDWNDWYNVRQKGNFSKRHYLRFYHEVQGLISRYWATSWNNAICISLLHRDLTFMWIDCQKGTLCVHQLEF